MDEEKMKLPGLDRVSVIGGLYPKLMTIADPPSFLERLTKEELVKMVEVSVKYQAKLLDVEMQRLKVQAEALEEVQKVVRGFK